MLAVSIVLLWTALLSAQPRLQIIQGGVINDLRGDMFAKTELSPTVYIDEVSGDVRGRIDRVEQFLQNKQWYEAVEMLVRLSAESQSKLTLSRANRSEHFPRYVTVHELVQEQIAVLSRESASALRQYRERVDPLAAQWLETGTNDGDEKILAKIVRESFHSSAGDDALLILGDLALEAGHHATARRHWNRIHPCLQWSDTQRKIPYGARLMRGEVISSIAKDLLSTRWSPSTYIDSEIPLADVWARLTLASILEGNTDRAASELAVMQGLWPEASGRLGGRDANYHRTLSSLLHASRLGPSREENSEWTTFAGGPTRNRLSDIEIDIPTTPSWRIPLRPATPNSALVKRVHNLPAEKSGESEPSSGHFPIVSNGLVFVHDQHRIRCLDLETGKPAWSEDSDGAFFDNTRNSDQQIRFAEFGQEQQATRLGEQRFTLSTSSETLVATIASHQGIGATGHPALVGFDLSTEGSVQFGPVELEDQRLSFHGGPLVEGNRCWVGMRMRDVSAQDFVACFDIRNGRELWRTRICSADTISRNLKHEVSSYLLSKNEDTLYCNSHLGTVAAISANDGSIRWLTKYPRTGPERANLLDEPWHALRDLTPCLYFEEVLIVAPADHRSIFALHAESGDMIWETEVPCDATQLLGIGDKHQLIVSGRRLWWIDVFTGDLSTHVAVNPFPSAATVEPTGAGRGVLSNGNVYWPVTEDNEAKIYVLSQADGSVQRQPIDLEVGNVRAGNLLVTPTHLLVAGPNELVAYRISRADADKNKVVP